MRKKNDHADREFTIEETILIERLRSFRVPALQICLHFCRKRYKPSYGWKGIRCF